MRWEEMKNSSRSWRERWKPSASTMNGFWRFETSLVFAVALCDWLGISYESLEKMRNEANLLPFQPSQTLPPNLFRFLFS